MYKNEFINNVERQLPEKNIPDEIISYIVGKLTTTTETKKVDENYEKLLKDLNDSKNEILKQSNKIVTLPKGEEYEMKEIINKDLTIEIIQSTNEREIEIQINQLLKSVKEKLQPNKAEELVNKKSFFY